MTPLDTEITISTTQTERQNIIMRLMPLIDDLKGVSIKPVVLLTEAQADALVPEWRDSDVPLQFYNCDTRIVTEDGLSWPQFARKLSDGLGLPLGRVSDVIDEILMPEDVA